MLQKVAKVAHKGTRLKTLAVGALGALFPIEIRTLSPIISLKHEEFLALWEIVGLCLELTLKSRGRPKKV